MLIGEIGHTVLMDVRLLLLALGIALVACYCSRRAIRRLHKPIDEQQPAAANADDLATLRDEFLVTINHQLRTPLTSIVSGIELLRDGLAGPVSEEHHTIVQSLSENAARLSHLVQEALDLSLLKSGQHPLRREPADLAALLRRSRAVAQASAPGRDIQLSCEELPLVYLDAQAVQEVLDHLLRNALRHALPQSAVVITSVARDGLVETSVHNQGAGLSPRQLQQVFQPFTHLHAPESPGSQGGGLGLAFCRQVIERHRGTIRAESKEGEGTTMTFTLPIVSPTFLFEEACRSAQESAEYESGQYGLVLARSATTAAMPPAETLLRKHTHRNDRFVRFDGLMLGVVAVTDQPGLNAIVRRLRGVLDQAHLDIRLASALFPTDAERPDRLLAVARERLSAERPKTRYATMDDQAEPHA